jgi:NAD(P) transhydrogenase subunit alpha
VKIAVLKETRVGENRVAITPQVAKSLIQMGNEVLIESGAGLGSHFSDDLYKDAGAQVVDRSAMKDAAMYVQINMPEATQAKHLAKGSLWVSLMYHRSNADLISAFNAEGVSVLSLDAIPRRSKAHITWIKFSQC